MSSVPPPSGPPPAALPELDPAPTRAGPELLLLLEEGRGRRKAARGEGDRLRLSADGISIEYGRMLHAPLRLPLGAVKVATVDRGPAKVGPQVGRFAVLRRLSTTTVIPRAEGIEGWLWTSSGGTAMTMLGHEDDAPNLALVFSKPLDEAQLRGAFRPDRITALAAHSALGSPTVLGLLLRVDDTAAAENGLRRWGFQSLLTDKEVPPTQRRHLATDTPADPIVIGGGSDSRRGATSVAPPGMS